MKKDYEKFNEQFSALIQEVKSTPEKTNVEKSLNIWKKYAEKLEKEPFRKLTTTEILEYSFTSELSEALKKIDRLIYGNQTQDNIFKELEVIEDFTQHRYSIKKMELKNDR
jgi:Txe/YoeB family toxin of Txe-Axe toxin-antitoxin module